MTALTGGATDPRSTALGGRWLAAALVLAGGASARAATLTVQDGPVVLGKTESSSVSILVDEGPGTEAAPLRLSVNVGAFSEPTRVGPGRYRATYSPPSTRFPQMALVAVWRETGADVRPDFLRLPLLGMARVPVTARPGAKVRVRLGAETFGPVQADRHGRAEVPVLVPPGSAQCEVILKDRRGELVKHVPVEVPPYNRLTAALVPHAAPADGRSEVQLFVFYDLGGSELPAERIRVTPSVGAVALRHAARGLYTFAYTPPAGPPGASVSFAVAVAGDPTARATAVLSLRAAPAAPVAPAPPVRVPPPPARVVVTAPATPLRAGASAVVDVLVLDASGAGLPGLEVSATANGEPLPAAAPRGDGHYELRFTAPAVPPPAGAVQLEAIAQHPDTFASGAARILLEVPPAPRPASARPPQPDTRAARVAPEPRSAVPTPIAETDDDRPAPPRRSPGGGSHRDPGRLLAGLGGGYAVSPGVASGPRAGAELWVAFHVLAAHLGVGAQVGVGTASTAVSDSTRMLRSTIDAAFVPVALKLGYEVFAGSRLSVALGAGPAAAYARFRSSLTSTSDQAVGFGWMAFLDAGWVLGPGAAVLGLSYGSTVVNTVDYRIDPGGFSAALSYRVRVL